MYIVGTQWNHLDKAIPLCISSEYVFVEKSEKYLNEYDMAVLMDTTCWLAADDMPMKGHSRIFGHLNPFLAEWTLPHYILEDSNFDFWYVRPHDLDIPREKMSNYLQTVETLIRCCILRRRIWVCTVCHLPF